MNESDDRSKADERHEGSVQGRGPYGGGVSEVLGSDAGSSLKGLGGDRAPADDGRTDVMQPGGRASDVNRAADVQERTIADEPKR